jgi:hypothetical protein
VSGEERRDMSGPNMTGGDGTGTKGGGGERGVERAVGGGLAVL